MVWGRENILSTFIFNFALENYILKIQENKEYLELNRIHQLLMYSGGFNLFGENINITVENTENRLYIDKEVGLKANNKNKQINYLHTCPRLITRPKEKIIT